MRFLATLLLASALTVATQVPAQGVGPTASLQQARRLANTGHGDDALKLLNQLPATASGVQNARGLAFYDLQQFPEADKAFAAALQQDPKDDEAAQMRGLTLFRLGRPAEAIPLLEATRGVDAQTKASPTYVLALCYVDTRRYDDARRAYAAQFGFLPDGASAYLLAARMLLRREYLPVAQRFATEALQRDPRLTLAHELLGEIALAGNHTEEAIQHFQQERDSNPLEPLTYERLGDAYSRLGRYPEARQALQRAVLLEPNSTAPYILLGKVTLKEGDAVAALTFLQRAERMDSANYMTHNLLAQTYRTLGLAPDAERERKLTEETQTRAEPRLTTLR